MTKQDYIDYRQGAAAYKKGEAFNLAKPHCWKMGWINTKQTTQPAPKETHT
ncbi:MAG TPA: hypothetical protein VGF65_11185 [Mycobacterium sp.]|jgi:hypothetical protein